MAVSKRPRDRVSKNMHLKLLSRNYLIALLVSAMIGLFLVLPGTSDAILNVINKDSNPKAISLKQSRYVQGQVLVKFKDGASRVDRRRMKNQAGIAKTVRKVRSPKKPRAGSIYLYKLKPGQSITKALAKISANNNVLSAQPNYIRKLSLTPNDPYFSDQWGLHNTGQSGGTPDADIDAPEGWDIENGTSNQVTVAVIDSGMDQTHPDLSAKVWQNSGEIPGNGIDDDGNSYVDDATGYNFAGISQYAFNAYWEVGRSDTNEYAQSIKGTGQSLSDVGLTIARQGSPSGNIEISIRETLTGPNLRSVAVTAGEVSTSYNEIYKSLDSSITLNSGQPYYIVFRSTAISNSKYYKVYGNASSIGGYVPDPYRDGIRHYHDGASWQSDPINDWYFRTNANPNPRDDNGHGTHVSGIAAASGDNGVGVAGVSFGADVMALKAGDSAGYLLSSEIIEAVYYAADNGADVINMSYGGGGYDSIEASALSYAYNNGVILFAASGNSYGTGIQYPAGYDNVVGVGATNRYDTKAGFSTYNSTVDLSAPGDEIMSTMPTYPVGLNSYGLSQNYAQLGGTSMATPMAAGLASLVLARNPSYSPAQVQQVMETYADDKGVAGRDDSFGWGRINAAQTLSNVPFFDQTTPLTTMIVSPPTPDGNDNWYTAGTTITLTPDETATTFYNWDGSADITYSTPFSSPEGEHDLSFFSIDTAGNTETPANTATIKTDISDPTDPNISSSSHSTGAISYDNTVDIAWPAVGAPGGATDTISGVDGYSFSWDTSSSTTPDDTKGAGGETTHTTSAPLQAGGNHWFHLRTVDHAGRWTSTAHLGPFIISDDTTAPVTTLSATGTVGDNGWFISDTSVTLTSDEPGTTYYKFDSTDTAGFTSGSTTVAPEGIHTIYYFSVDTMGNTETIKNQLIKVDVTDPIDPALTSPSHVVDTTSNDQTIDIDIVGATDTLSGVEGFSITWSPNASETPDEIINASATISSTTSPHLAKGIWWANASTKDHAGRWTSTAHLGPFIISDDTTAPITTLATSPTVADGANGWFVTAPTIDLSRDEPGTTYYKFDSTDTAGFTSGSTTVAPEGIHTIYYFSVDTMGNTETPENTATVKVDITIPTGSLSINSGATYTKSTGVTLNLSASDGSGSGMVEMSFMNDGGSWTTTETYSTSKIWTLSSGDGTKKVWVKYKDAAGNVSLPYSDTITLDTKAPIAKKVTAPNVSTRESKTTNFKVSWSASDPSPSSGIKNYDLRYKIGKKGSWNIWKTVTTATSATFKGKAGSTYYIQVRATDNAGNVSKYSKYRWTIVPYDNGQQISSRKGFAGKVTQKSSRYYKKSIRFSKSAGDEIVYRFTGNKVYLIATKAKKRNKAEIYIDGKYKRTINTKSTKSRYRQEVYHFTFSKIGTHNLKIVNVGNEHRLDLDGLAVRR